MSTPIPQITSVPVIIHTASGSGGLELWPLALVGLILAMVLIVWCATLQRRVQSLESQLDDAQSAIDVHYDNLGHEIQVIKGVLRVPPRQRDEAHPDYFDRWN